LTWKDVALVLGVLLEINWQMRVVNNAGRLADAVVGHCAGSGVYLKETTPDHPEQQAR
jgi:hypothetical protein